jgi:hypothetical protein
MIPYEELVYALQNWRVKQGLPVSSPVAPRSGSGPTHAAPSMDVHGYEAAEEVADDALVDEAHYEGDEFGMGTRRAVDVAETQLGEGRPSEHTFDEGMPGGSGSRDRNEDW